jgi:hypothetical protein
MRFILRCTDPWTSSSQTSFSVEVYNYRFNTSRLRDPIPWSRVLEKVIVSRLINKFPTTCDEELLYPSFLIYLISLPLHRSDHLLVAAAWIRPQTQTGQALRMHGPECLRFRKYSDKSYERQSKCFQKRRINLPGRSDVSLAGPHCLPTTPSVYCVTKLCYQVTWWHRLRAYSFALSCRAKIKIICVLCFSLLWKYRGYDSFVNHRPSL